MSNYDAYMQVAPDSTGKRVEMDLLAGAGTDATGAAVDVYRQRAAIVGDTADAILEMNATMEKILAVLRAMLAIQQLTTTTQVLEEDFQFSSNPKEY